MDLDLFCRGSRQNVLDRKSFLEVEVWSSKRASISDLSGSYHCQSIGAFNADLWALLSEKIFSRTAIEPCALQLDDRMVSSLPEHVQIWLEIRLQANCHLRLDFNLITSMVSRSSPRPPPRSPPGLTCQRCWEPEWARPICSYGLRAGLPKRCPPCQCLSLIILCLLRCYFTV